MHPGTVALTIAGSDSGGGAGVQADLKTFACLGLFGTSALTCVTAQNPRGVRAIVDLTPEALAAQIDAVFDGFPVSVVKTGMLFSEPLVHTVCEALTRYTPPHVVVDPVMVATSGAALLESSAVQAVTESLLPLATVVTPNIPEAELLIGRDIETLEQQTAAAESIHSTFGCAAIVKGGHMPGARLVDVLCSADGCVPFSFDRVPVEESHGTGCTFSAAVAACLGLGYPIPDAVERGRAYVADCLREARKCGVYTPMGWCFHEPDSDG